MPFRPLALARALAHRGLAIALGLALASCATGETMAKGVVFRFSFRDRDNGLLLRSDVDEVTCAELRARGETLPS